MNAALEAQGLIENSRAMRCRMWVDGESPSALINHLESQATEVDTSVNKQTTYRGPDWSVTAYR